MKRSAHKADSRHGLVPVQRGDSMHHSTSESRDEAVAAGCTPSQPAAAQTTARAADLRGRRYHDWTVIDHLPPVAPHRRGRCWCRCECGAEREVPSNALVGGASKSCGCARAKWRGITRAEKAFAAQKLAEQLNVAVELLRECTDRFEWCCVCSGSDKQFAAAAVSKYRIFVADFPT